MFQDNVLLIEEINNLRKEVVEKKKIIKDLSSIVGLSKLKSSKEAQKKLELAIQSRQTIHEEYKSKIKVKRFVCLYLIFTQ